MPGCHQPSYARCVFNLPRADRIGRHVYQQAGNSMHVGVMSILQLYSFAAVKHRKLSSLLANVRIARAALRAEKKRQRDSNAGAGPFAVKRRLQGKQTDPVAAPRSSISI